MFDLTGKVVLVAGGAGYLGTSVCKGLAGQNADVVIADLDAERAAAVAETIGREFPNVRVIGKTMDVGDEASVKRVMADIKNEFGKLDVSVNATAMSIGKTPEEITVEEFDRSNHVNITGSFVFARESATLMIEGGSIIFFTSMYGLIAPDPGMYKLPMLPNPIEYGVAKAGLVQMVKYLAVHWAKKGIRVNAVAPGPFPNPNIQRDTPDFIERLADHCPMGRIGQSKEMVGSVVFLASDDSSYVTGETISVDGGWTKW